MANTLSTKGSLDDFLSNQHLAGEVWVVYNKQDYRTSLAAIFSLISKATVGLGNVDNTSDINKPISAKVAEALSKKLDITALAEAVSGFVSLDILNQSVETLTQAISGKASTEDMNAAISAAVSPILETVSAIQTSLTNLKNVIDAGVVSTETYNQGISRLDQLLAQKVSSSEMSTQLDSLRNNFSSALGQGLGSLDTKISANTTAITKLIADLEKKLDIDDSLTEAVKMYIDTTVSDALTGFGESYAKVAEHQW